MCKMSHFLWIWEGLDGCDVCRLLGTNQLLYGCFPATKDGVMSVFLKIAIPLANSISQNNFCSLESIFYSYYSNNVLVEFFKSRSGIWQGSMCYSSAWWCMRTWVRKKAVQDVWSNTAPLNTARWRLPHSSCPTAVNGWVHKILTQSFYAPKVPNPEMKKCLPVSHSYWERQRIFRGLALLSSYCQKTQFTNRPRT